eukprot:SM000019S05059  [mRNA]  locus=s19:715974:720047:+ [translate_table: standard]
MGATLLDGAAEHVGGAAPNQQMPPATGRKVGELPEHYQRQTISEIVQKAIAERVFPGAAVAFGGCDIPCYFQGYGTYTFESSMEIKLDAIWDLASLTKVMVTVPAIMLLYERSQIDLDAPACQYLPEFGQNGKHVITIRMLLTHTAGLKVFYPFFQMDLVTKEEVDCRAHIKLSAQHVKYVLNFIMMDKLEYPPGEMAHYSDLSMIMLGLIIESVVKTDLASFIMKELFLPMGLKQTSFRPVESTDFDPIVVPTEVDVVHRNRLLWGEGIHDPTAYILGGVAGHAGLFSTILDVSHYAQMLLSGGLDSVTGRRFFQEKTVRTFTRPPAPTVSNPRPFALGFDVSVRRGLNGYTSAGQYLGPRTFGHTGFTGTSLWIDPDRNIFVALLSNAVHPSAALDAPGQMISKVRPLVADAAVQAMAEQLMPREQLTWHLPASCDLHTEPSDRTHEHDALTLVALWAQDRPNVKSADWPSSRQRRANMAVPESPKQDVSTSHLDGLAATGETAQRKGRWRKLMPVAIAGIALYVFH